MANTATDTRTSNETTIDGGLKLLLADSYQLMSLTHLAHWNVEGSDFFQLHEAFQAHYEELFAAIDDIAERLRAIGAYAPGGLDQLASLSEIGEFDAQLPARDFVVGLIVSHEKLIENAIQLRSAAGDGGDAETEDLVIGRIQAHQKTVWMLKSFLK